MAIGTDLVPEIDYDIYKAMIDRHFKIKYKNRKCDYNITHFMTEGIRDNRYYETAYCGNFEEDEEELPFE